MVSPRLRIELKSLEPALQVPKIRLNLTIVLDRRDVLRLLSPGLDNRDNALDCPKNLQVVRHQMQALSWQGRVDLSRCQGLFRLGQDVKYLSPHRVIECDAKRRVDAGNLSPSEIFSISCG